MWHLKISKRRSYLGGALYIMLFGVSNRISFKCHENFVKMWNLQLPNSIKKWIRIDISRPLFLPCPICIARKVQIPCRNWWHNLMLKCRCLIMYCIISCIVNGLFFTLHIRNYNEIQYLEYTTPSLEAKTNIAENHVIFTIFYVLYLNVDKFVCSQ